MMASAAYVGDFTTDDILGAQGRRRRHRRRSARQHRLSRRSARSARRNSALSSNCISSRARSWRPRTRPSAWSIPARACCGTTARSPASKAMPAPRRCRCAATRWRRCRRSCWRWSASPRQHGPKAVGTIGEAVIASPSRNVIPGEIAFTVDCRSADAAIMDALDRDLRAAIAEIAARRKVEVALDLVWRKPPTHFDRKAGRRRGERGQDARLFAPPHHLRRRPRRLQPRPM